MNKITNFTQATGMGGKQTYKINGATYVVSSRFLPIGSSESIENKVKKLLKNEFAHLNLLPDDDTIKSENVCSAVGKEDKNAVEKQSA